MVREILVSRKFPLVILDELNVALGLSLIDPESVKAVLAERDEQQHLVVTGRGAPDWLIEMADMVTEMREVKHPYQKGILAQKGIDW
jgi:cob(I)alamin adenosyltransferase